VEIDLFTVIAQIVNFIILLLLLKYLLYGRIIKAMDEREEMIASRLREAEEEKARAQREHQSLLSKEEKLDEEKEEKLREAVDEAESKKKEMIEAARQEAGESRKRWLQSVERQKESFLKDLRLRSGKEVYAVAKKALKDIAGADLENEIIRTFSDRLDQLPQETRKEIVDLAQSSGEKVMIHTSFPLNSKTKKSLLSGLRKHLGKDLELAFEVSEELICGIELRAGDRRVSWSLNNYLSILEDKVSASFEEATPGEGREEPESSTE
jgi:F-type H+-transporting ATPase subunit b